MNVECTLGVFSYINNGVWLAAEVSTLVSKSDNPELFDPVRLFD